MGDVFIPGEEVNVSVGRNQRKVRSDSDADAAFERLRRAEAHLHNDEVIHLDGSPPMFFFADPDGNGLVYLQETDS